MVVDGSSDEVQLVEGHHEKAVLFNRLTRQLVDLFRLLSQANADNEHVDVCDLCRLRLRDCPLRVQVRHTIRENDSDVRHVGTVAFGVVEHLAAHGEDGIGRVRTSGQTDGCV